MLREHAANGLRALGFPAGPVGLGVVEDRGADKRVSALDQVADAFHIPDETAEMTVLGVMPVRIEMRRAVFVGERRGGEGMGHKVVDAAHHEVDGLGLADKLARRQHLAFFGLLGLCNDRYNFRQPCSIFFLGQKSFLHNLFCLLNIIFFIGLRDHDNNGNILP